MKVKTPTPAEDTRSSSVPYTEKTNKTQLPQPGLKINPTPNNNQNNVKLEANSK